MQSRDPFLCPHSLVCAFMAPTCVCGTKRLFVRSLTVYAVERLSVPWIGLLWPGSAVCALEVGVWWASTWRSPAHSLARASCLYLIPNTRRASD